MNMRKALEDVQGEHGDPGLPKKRRGSPTAVLMLPWEASSE